MAKGTLREIPRGFMNSLSMALDAILWLKQEKGCFLHCTEYGYEWRADAIGFNGKDLIEVEVKTSWTDFKADFKKVKKHQVLLDKYNGCLGKIPYNYIPNYLYYLVTPDLAVNAIKYLKANNLPYGVMIYKEPDDYQQKGYFESAKNVKRIHTDPISEKLKSTMMARMSNEYIYGFIDMKNRLYGDIKHLIDKSFRDSTRISFDKTEESIDRIFKQR